MCLAIPAQICELLDDEHFAMVNILGVRRRVNIDLMSGDPPLVGDWVLIHVGFAMTRISAGEADEQLRLLNELGEAAEASHEVARFPLGLEDAEEGNAP